MNRCLELAAKGRNFVTPNPMVGSVIVLEQEIIGEGFHARFGDAHAEVNAIEEVANHEKLKRATLYVSLEPCSHFGKTPPCADLIIARGIKRVVIGTLDPNPIVSGKGIERLMNNGVQVTIGVLEDQCKQLNYKYFTYFKNKRPHITLKWAQTQNGIMNNGEQESGRNWISSPETQIKVHEWRAQHHAILVGYNTVRRDNPSLDVRRIDGKNPIRIILDPKNELGNQYKCFAEKGTHYRFILQGKKKSDHDIEISDWSASSIVNKLFDLKIQSVFIEGGSKTLSMFIQKDLWDDAINIVGQNEFKTGIKAPEINGVSSGEEIFFGDHIHYLKNI